MLIQKTILYFLFSGMIFAKNMLLFYCGTTMAVPMREIADHIEKKYGCSIKIIQGGSKDLYNTLVFSKKGDIFFPGDSKYITMADKYVTMKRELGYNHLALFVKKGNPHAVSGMKDLIREDILVSLGNPETCSIGKAAEESILKYGGKSFLKNVKENLSFYASDSRDLNHIILDEAADIGLNWKATQYFPDYENKLMYIPLDAKYAITKRLVIARLSFSQSPEIAQALIQYAASPEGKAILKKYGFIDE